MTEDNVIEFPKVGIIEDVPVNDILSAIIQNEKLDTIVLIGVREDGGAFLASSTGDRYKMLWFLEQAKLDVLGFNGEE